MIKVLFVCMGNICRSPTAEGVFTHLAEQTGLRGSLEIDSAGTHAYHIGEPPDPRAQEAAYKRGISLNHLRARRVEAKDFAEYDYILAMDHGNYEDLSQACPPEYQDKLHLLLDFAPEYKAMKIEEVPDPYYGGRLGFEHVLDLTEAAAKGLLEDIRRCLNTTAKT